MANKYLISLHGCDRTFDKERRSLATDFKLQLGLICTECFLSQCVLCCTDHWTGLSRIAGNNEELKVVSLCCVNMHGWNHDNIQASLYIFSLMPACVFDSLVIFAL